MRTKNRKSDKQRKSERDLRGSERQSSMVPAFYDGKDLWDEMAYSDVNLLVGCLYCTCLRGVSSIVNIKFLYWYW